MKVPFVLPHDPIWSNLSAEEIYEKLNRCKERKLKSIGCESENIKGLDGNGFDEHIWDGRSIETVVGEGFDSDFTPKFEKDVVEKCRARIISASQMVERIQGNLPDYLKTIVGNITKPSLRWQEILAQFVTSCYGSNRRWFPPSRRHFHQGLYLPSRYSLSLNAVIAIDTSGSTMEELPQFFGELNSLIDSFGRYDLMVIQCDCAIQNISHFTSDTPFPSNYVWEAMGHGGTDFCPVFDWVEKERLSPTLLIYITDGYGSAPEKSPNYPVLWVMVKENDAPVEWGSVCSMK